MTVVTSRFSLFLFAIIDMLLPNVSSNSKMNMTTISFFCDIRV